MATITAAALRNRALQKLRVLKPGEDASAEDAALVDAAYTAMYAEFVTRGIAAWTETAIDDEWTEPARVVLAARVADDFHVPEPRLGRLLQEAAIAEARLREMVSAYEPHPIDYEFF